MPRDAMGNIIPGSYNPDGSINKAALGRPMNPSPRAAQMLSGTARALANPGAAMRNQAATEALQRANAGVVKPPPPAAMARPPLRQGASPLAGDLAARAPVAADQSAKVAAIQEQRAAPAPVNQSDRAAQMLAQQQDMARMQAARTAAAPPVAADRQAQLQQQQADLIRQRQAAMQQRAPMGLGTAILR